MTLFKIKMTSDCPKRGQTFAHIATFAVAIR